MALIEAATHRTGSRDHSLHERTTVAGVEVEIDPEDMERHQRTRRQRLDLHRQRQATTRLRQMLCRKLLRRTEIERCSSRPDNRLRRRRLAVLHMASHHLRPDSHPQQVLQATRLQQDIHPRSSPHQLAMACLLGIRHPGTRHLLAIHHIRDIQDTHHRLVTARHPDIRLKRILSSLVTGRHQAIHLLVTLHRLQVMAFLQGIHHLDTPLSQFLAMALHQGIHLQGTLHQRAITLLHQACLHSHMACHLQLPQHLPCHLAGTWGA
mmetsp:Transcript_65809/g.122734  ORF Transcript_65809/g.122734 Transcript_65809/m.122734 type:complete len:265 (+) Transcript_65809:386-1180(+)